MSVEESARRKIENGKENELAHEEWDWWRLCGKNSKRCRRYIATVVHDDQTLDIDIYHDEIDAAAGTAKVLFDIGLPSVLASSIRGIRISNEQGDENRYLSRNGEMVSEYVCRG